MHSFADLESGNKIEFINLFINEGISDAVFLGRPHFATYLFGGLLSLPLPDFLGVFEGKPAFPFGLTVLLVLRTLDFDIINEL